MKLQAIDNFYKTRPGHFIFGLVELVLGLEFANLAIPSGDWWEWLLTFLCFFGCLQNIGRMIAGGKE